MSELAQGQADLTPEDVDWLHLLLGDWQLLADLSFADLVLWLPLPDGASAGFLAAAQMRPTTGPTVHHDDIVGT
ncbi:MAG: histidine kinase N-terminal domain-containing protein, partial [Actinomycetota bacterium]|nr:histidine kinase N-terminal domain-containing protein [Actinomycetota bacterium]